VSLFLFIVIDRSAPFQRTGETFAETGRISLNVSFLQVTQGRILLQELSDDRGGLWLWQPILSSIFVVVVVQIQGSYLLQARFDPVHPKSRKMRGLFGANPHANRRVADGTGRCLARRRLLFQALGVEDVKAIRRQIRNGHFRFSRGFVKELAFAQGTFIGKGPIDQGGGEFLLGLVQAGARLDLLFMIIVVVVVAVGRRGYYREGG
jgi:hypothetical protein